MLDTKLFIDQNSLDELAKAQLPKVIEYCEKNGIESITKASPVWMGIDSKNNAVIIPHIAYKPDYPGS